MLLRSVLSRAFSFVTRLKNYRRIGRNAFFVVPFSVKASGPYKFGVDFFAGPGLYISTNRFCTLTISDAVIFGPRVMILGGNHVYDGTDKHMRYHHDDDPRTLDIKIGEGAWIGANTVILSGANIGEGCVVGAQALVNGELAPYSIAVGSPARSIRCRFKTCEDLETCLRSTGSLLTIDEILNIYSQHDLEPPLFKGFNL